MTGRRVLLGVLLVLAFADRATAAATFDVVLHGAVVGQVTLDDQARIKIISVKPDRADWLRRLVHEMNATSVMHADAPPRDDAPPSTSASRIIRRNDADFVPALRHYIRAYYGAELRPQAPGSQSKT